MRRFLFSFMLVACAAAGAFAQAVVNNDMTPANTISAQPINNYFTLKAGETQSVNILVSNKMPKKMQFNVYIGDWRRDSTGAHVYSEPGTEERSCAKWITVSPKFLEVDSNSAGTVNVKLQIPDSADAVKEMKWAMVFIETIETAKAPENTKEMRSQIVPRTRFGIHVNQTPPSVKQQEIKMIGFTPMAGQKDKFRIIAQNTGEVEMLCKSYIELSSQEDGKKYSVTQIQVPLFPEQKRYFDFQLPPDLPKGKYTMVGVVDPGNDLDIEAAQMMVTVE